MNIVECSHVVDAASILTKFKNDCPLEVWKRMPRSPVEDKTTRIIRFTFATATDAEIAANKLKGITQSQGKKLTVIVIEPPPPPAIERVRIPDLPPPVVNWGSDDRKPGPYHFVPVWPAVGLNDTPVAHDRLDLGDDALTGELLCTMTALTPLLAANDQYAFEDAERDVQAAFLALVQRQLPGHTPESKKKILEPLTKTPQGHSEPGPVLIAGASLKGMLRQSLGALLSAPMERVAEKTYSYRPNIKTEAKGIRICKPALVIEAKRDKRLEVLVLNRLNCVGYVHPFAEANWPRLADLAALSQEEREAIYLTEQSSRPWLITDNDVSLLRQAGVTCSAGGILRDRRPNPVDLVKGHLICLNHNGIDLLGRLNERFHESCRDDVTLMRQLETKSELGYRFLHLNLEDSKRATLDPGVVEDFYTSLRHLADTEAGHLTTAHPLIERGDHFSDELTVFRERGLRPGDVLFLEQTTIPEGNTSVGHQFYYRHAYRDSIHRTAMGADQAQATPGAPFSLRDVLCPREFETGPTPRRLSGARLLFGYVSTSTGRYKPKEPLTFGIGHDGGKPTDYAALAGRISINMAVERGSSITPMDARFLGSAGDQWLVPLRALGSPKASAVEHYLTQDERVGRRDDAGILCT
jgi:hypothetical protein